jgi:ABC-type lipoprotein export system ATPase subunit
MYKLENITKRFNGQQVLRGASLAVGEKEMISIMGKSGAGKSTLLGVMAGLIKADGGKIIFQDQDISSLDEEGLAAFRLRHIGIVFQDFKLIPSLSVFDNVLLGIHPRRDVSKQEKARRIHALAEEVGLQDKLQETVDNLSGGEKQRVAIARSLVNAPTVVLADEPTGNLDEKTAGTILDLFDRLHQHLSTTFIIVTHDKDIAQRTQKIYNLQEGMLLCS